MSSQAHRLKIGLFVVASLMLGVMTVIWLGASRYFQESQTFVAYFTDSVQGLETGSPVKFRGVSVGRVNRIKMAPDAQHIEVEMGLQPGFKVDENLGIRMSLLGLTGQKYLEMDKLKPEEKREPVTFDFKPPYPVIATYPSEIKDFVNAMDNIFQKIKAVDLAKISNHLVRVSAKLDKILSDPNVDNMGADAAETLREMKTAAKQINQEVARLRLSKRLGNTLDNASSLLKDSSGTVRSVDRMIHRTDNNLNRLTRKLDRSVDNLLEFTRIIRKNPKFLLYGSPDKPETGP